MKDEDTVKSNVSQDGSKKTLQKNDCVQENMSAHPETSHCQSSVAEEKGDALSSCAQETLGHEKQAQKDEHSKPEAPSCLEESGVKMPKKAKTVIMNVPEKRRKSRKMPDLSQIQKSVSRLGDFFRARPQADKQRDALVQKIQDILIASHQLTVAQQTANDGNSKCNIPFKMPDFTDWDTEKLEAYLKRLEHERMARAASRDAAAAHRKRLVKDLKLLFLDHASWGKDARQFSKMNLTMPNFSAWSTENLEAYHQMMLNAKRRWERDESGASFGYHQDLWRLCELFYLRSLGVDPQKRFTMDADLIARFVKQAAACCKDVEAQFEKEMRTFYSVPNFEAWSNFDLMRYLVRIEPLLHASMGPSNKAARQLQIEHGLKPGCRPSVSEAFKDLENRIQWHHCATKPKHLGKTASHSDTEPRGSQENVAAQTAESQPKRSTVCDAVQTTMPMEMPKRSTACESVSRSTPPDVPKRSTVCDAVQTTMPMEMPKRSMVCESVSRSTPPDVPKRSTVCDAVQTTMPMEMPKPSTACEGVSRSTPPDVPKRSTVCDAVQTTMPMEMPKRSTVCESVSRSTPPDVPKRSTVCETGVPPSPPVPPTAGQLSSASHRAVERRPELCGVTLVDFGASAYQEDAWEDVGTKSAMSLQAISRSKLFAVSAEPNRIQEQIGTSDESKDLRSTSASYRATVEDLPALPETFVAAHAELKAQNAGQMPEVQKAAVSETAPELPSASRFTAASESDTLRVSLKGLEADSTFTDMVAPKKGEGSAGKKSKKSKRKRGDKGVLVHDDGLPVVMTGKEARALKAKRQSEKIRARCVGDLDVQEALNAANRAEEAQTCKLTLSEEFLSLLDSHVGALGAEEVTEHWWETSSGSSDILGELPTFTAVQTPESAGIFAMSPSEGASVETPTIGHESELLERQFIDDVMLWIDDDSPLDPRVAEYRRFIFVGIREFLKFLAPRDGFARIRVYAESIRILRELPFLSASNPDLPRDMAGALFSVLDLITGWSDGLQSEEKLMRLPLIQAWRARFGGQIAEDQAFGCAMHALCGEYRKDRYHPMLWRYAFDMDPSHLDYRRFVSCTEGLLRWYGLSVPELPFCHISMPLEVWSQAWSRVLSPLGVALCEYHYNPSFAGSRRYFFIVPHGRIETLRALFTALKQGSHLRVWSSL